MGIDEVGIDKVGIDEVGINPTIHVLLLKKCTLVLQW